MSIKSPKWILCVSILAPLSTAHSQDYNNGNIVKTIYKPEVIETSEISSRLLNLAPYDSSAAQETPVDNKGYFVFRHVQRNTSLGKMLIQNSTNLQQYTGLAIVNGQLASHQRTLSNAYPGTGSSGAQSYGSSFGAMINMWDVNPHNSGIEDGGPQGAFEVYFTGSPATLPRPWTTPTSALTVQAATSIPWMSFGNSTNCSPSTNPAAATLSWGLSLRDTTSPDTQPRFINWGISLYDSRPANCAGSITGENVYAVDYGAAKQARVSSILKPNSKYIDVSPFVAANCKTAKNGGAYGGECWTRTHIPRSKLTKALTDINAYLGKQCGSVNAYSCNPSDYVISIASIGVEMYGVAGFPYATNSMSIGYMIGDVHVYEMN